MLEDEEGSEHDNDIGDDTDQDDDKESSDEGGIKRPGEHRSKSKRSKKIAP